ncbi:hypothetical protein HMPREF0083_06189 [Aneurinibacillus aneurinilyticus ATCC 12856]|uniref:Uncharacterized protein n=1 Tax=Aneurinibacillus aneurinilyticus ATCC 12856 TaxID=649747 RepID=U1XZ87_ANEAE|nr:hypothetical protein HMPREF0083_06189 [Aneurinibacillus aneurinilyticus ATCC 12856]
MGFDKGHIGQATGFLDVRLRTAGIAEGHKAEIPSKAGEGSRMFFLS